MGAALVLAASVLLQFAAVLLALRLTWVTRAGKGWVLIALAVFLMAVRRSITLLRLMSGDLTHPPDLAAELVALGISILMVAGIAWIAPLFLAVKRAGDALRESEERYRTLFDRTANPILVINHEGDYLACNEAALRFLECTRDELLTKSIHDFLPPGEREQVLREHVPMWESGGTAETEYYVHGKLKTLELTITPSTWQGKRVVFGVGRDITERKRAEEALRRSERQASAAVEAARALTFSYDIATGKISWGGAIEEITGYTPEEFAPVDIEGWAERIHPDDRDQVLSILGEAIQEKDRATAEYRFNTKKGYVTLASISITERENGKAVRLVGILQDITEVKNAEDKLRESEQRYRAIFEQAADSIVLVDTETGALVEFNDKACQNLGYTREEFQKLKIQDFEVVESAEQVAEHIKKIVREGSDAFETKHRTRSGEIRHILVSTRVVSLAKRSFALGIWRDITERKRAEETLQLSHRILEIANRPAKKALLLNELAREIQDCTGCSAVGIRVLDEEGNIPYEGKVGFSDRFYQLESPLSIKSDHCMCINVIKGQTDPKLPFATEGGSFYMNGTTRFLATVSEEEKGQTRNACNEFGYESVALIPIHLGKDIVGLIHVADQREDQVPLGMVETLESIARQLSPTICRLNAEEELQTSLKEKEMLLREVHHRVKNNMLVMTSLVKLQARKFKGKPALGAFVETLNRIKAMALVHETLYESERLAAFDLQKYIERLTRSLLLSYGRGKSSVNLIIDVCGVTIGIDDVVPVALIINELVSNSFKYAFSEKRRGEIRIAARPAGKDDIELVVSDDGVGLPQEIDPHNTETVGLGLVVGLAENQLGGSVEVARAGGTQFTIRFRQKSSQKRI